MTISPSKMTDTSNSRATTMDAVNTFIRKYGSFVTLLIIITASSIISRNFLTTTNIFLVLRQTAVLGIVAIGQTFVILTGGTDLSVSSLVSLSVVLITNLYGYNDSMAFPLLFLVLAIGIITGFTNGFFISRLKIPPIVMTLGMQTLVLGAGLMYSKGVPNNRLTESFRFIGLGKIGEVPMPVIIWGVIIIIAVVLLYYTNYGRHIYAVGGNAEAARFSGINVKNTTMLAYIISGICAVLAGYVLAARIGVGDNWVGVSMSLDSIAAVVIGGTAFTGGRGGVLTTIAGVLIMSFLYNLLLLMGVNYYWQEVVKGLVILLGVILYTTRSQHE
jgi:ribose/xylose/arabinose/galactoside ABC-type transport system permease subunit